jgi:hypothetical protein
MLLTGVTNASAGYCSLDPTVGVGLPIHTNTTISTYLLGTSTYIYAYNSSKTTTFGGEVGTP